MWYFHARDSFPEPARVLWSTFGLGILIVFPVVAFALPADQLIQASGNYLLYGALEAFLAAAIPEELGKAAVLVGYSMRRKEFNEPIDGIVYGVAASMGFATLENVLYVAGGGGPVAFLRAATAVPAHAFTGAIMGYYAGLAWQGMERRNGLLMQGIGLAILLHGLYDVPIMVLKAMREGTAHLPAQENDLAGFLFLLTIGVLVFEWWLATRLVIRARRGQQIATQPAIPTGSPPSATAGAWRSGWQRAVDLGMVIVGGLVASAGSLILLALLIAFAIGSVEGADTAYVIAGGVIIGVLPAAVGIWLFLQGIKRMNRT